MTTIKKVKGTAKTMPMGVTLGVSVSLLITIVLAAVLTWGAIEGKVAEKTIGYMTMGILLISSILGTLLSALKIQRRRMLVCCVTGGVYYLVLLGGTAVFFGGNYRGTGVTGGLVLLGSLISGLLSLNANKRRAGRYKKYRTG